MSMQDWTVEEYHAYPAISSGGLRCFRTEGPLEYHRRFVAREEAEEQTDWMRLGSAFHLAMEDMEKFMDSYVIVPDLVPDSFGGGPQTDAEKKAREAEKQPIPGTYEYGMPINKRMKRHAEYLQHVQQQAAAEGKSWLTRQEADAQLAQVKAVWDNKAARKLLESEVVGKEVPYLTECPHTGLPKKALADMIVMFNGRRTLVDWKTTRTRTAATFFWDAIGYPILRDGELVGWRKTKQYAHQIAHYEDVIEGIEDKIIVSVTNQGAIEAMVYRVSDEIVEHARQMNLATIRSIAACHEFDCWHCDGWGEIVTLGGDDYENFDDFEDFEG